jgi:translocation and assembly module TamA
MPALPARCLTALLLAATACAAQAATVTRVDVRGLDELEAQNVRDALSLQQAVGKNVSGRRLGVLLRAVEDEARGALEPFGYYDPRIDVARTGAADAPVVVITVDPGTPVRVRGFSVVMEGPGGSDPTLREDLAAFAPRSGAVFAHATYEASKARVNRRLAERGYFDADLTRHRVEVTRAAHAADIDLAWASGARYMLGQVNFTQTPEIIRPQLLQKLVRWPPGQAYDQEWIDRLRTSLQALDYFSQIDVVPQPQQAVDHRVPVDVHLTPAKRSIYTAGVSYGTDSGTGVRLGVERRYLNARGHKALAQIDYAQKRKTATLQYRIPAFAWLDGWYTLAAQYTDEQTDYINSRRVELVASRSGQVNRHLTAIAALHLLRERWAYVPVGGSSNAPPTDYQYGTFLYPSLRGEYIDVDDRLFPRRGIGGYAEVRSGAQALGSDADFAQLHAEARWFQGLGVRNRLLVRGELGHTFTNALVDMPPSLRFYAGGARSIRGYSDREVGPRLETGGGLYSVGAKNVLTGSVEGEHFFTDQWGGAVYVDSGSAFDGTVPDWRTGVGVGVRWRSPVGLVRVDVARGLDHPDSPFTVFLNIGSDL